MSFDARLAIRITIIMLLSVVVTQLIYIALSNAGLDINRPVIWTTEAVAFLAISVFALVPALRGSPHAAAWVAVAMGGLLNVIQVGMGLAMFPPLKDAGEGMAAAFEAVLAGAFFLYFAGKFLFGFAGVVFGLALMRDANLPARAVGIFAGLTGLAAIVVNTYAMAAGMDVVFIAGAIGTAATLFLAIAMIMIQRQQLR